MNGSRSNGNNNGSSGRQGSSSNDQYQYWSNREGSPEWSTFSTSSGGRPVNTGYTLDCYERDHEANPTFYGHGQSRSEATQQYIRTWDHHWRQLGNATQSQGQGQTDNTYYSMYDNGGNMNGYGAGHGAGYGAGYETGYGQNSGLGYNSAATGGISTSQHQVDGYANERRFADGEDNEYEDGDVGSSAQHSYREKDRKKSKGKDKSKSSGSGKHRKY